MQVLVSTCSNGYLSTNNYFASTDAQDKYGRYLAETDHNMFVLASTFQIILVSRLPVSVPTKYLIGKLRLCTQVAVQVPRSTSTLIATLIGISTSIFQCIFYDIKQYIILEVPAPHFKLIWCIIKITYISNKLKGGTFAVPMWR